VKLGQRRSLNVLAMVSGIRAAYPELRAPLSLATMRQVLRAEDIKVERVPIRPLSWVEGGLGSYVVMLRSGLKPTMERRVLAHEYAHIKLHYESSDEVVHQQQRCTPGDPRELEALLFVRLLILGDEATPDHPKIAEVVAALDAPALTSKLPPPPAQLPLPLPEKMPEVKAEPPAFAHERAHQRKLAAKGQKRLLKPFIDRPAPDDFYRVKFYDPTSGATRFIDVAGRIWLIYNYRIVTNGAGVRSWELVKDFMSPDVEFRFFMSTYGVKRVYRFPNRRETRAYRAQHLDRQVAQSKVVPTPLAPRIPRRAPARDDTRTSK
jgi:hypothetical protein